MIELWWSSGFRGGLWSLISQGSKAKGLWSYSKLLCYVTLCTILLCVVCCVCAFIVCLYVCAWVCVLIFNDDCGIIRRILGLPSGWNYMRELNGTPKTWTPSTQITASDWTTPRSWEHCVLVLCCCCLNLTFFVVVVPAYWDTLIASYGTR